MRVKIKGYYSIIMGNYDPIVWEKSGGNALYAINKQIFGID